MNNYSEQCFNRDSLKLICPKAHEAPLLNGDEYEGFNFSGFTPSQLKKTYRAISANIDLAMNLGTGNLGGAMKGISKGTN